MKKPMFAALIVSLTAVLIGFTSPVCAAMVMPKQIHGIQLGMDLNRLLEVRPELKNILSRDPDWRSGRKSGVIVDNRLPHGEFDKAIYLIQDHQVVGIQLYMFHSKNMAAPLRRAQAYKSCIARWGKKHRDEVGTLEPGSKDAKKKTPAAIWDTPLASIYLFAPATTGPKTPRTILTMILKTKKGELAPGFSRADASDSEKVKTFNAAGFKDE